MLFPNIFKAACAVVAVAAVSSAAPAPAERVVPLKPSAQQKLDAMKRWQQHIMAKTNEVASKYPMDHISHIPDYSLFDEFQDTGKLPEPIRGKTGSKIYGPSNTQIDRQNPDTFAPPYTDSGSVPQSKWPFALSHTRLQNGGWTRQQNKDVLPVSTDLAGVQMHLDYGVMRELHWHTASEWAYVLNGTFRFSVLDGEGRNYVADLSEGDLWFSPSGTPHSIQALSPGGGEFLLVFDDGGFNEDETFLLSDFVAHIPREVILKNFPGFEDKELDNLPKGELYIFPNQTSIQSLEEEFVPSPQGRTPIDYVYYASKQPVEKLPGGSVKIVDSRNFTASKNIAFAEVTINPGAMRELHWHNTAPEWDFFISGRARITVWAGNNNARTFNFEAGDVAVIPKVQGHYIEALGDEPVKYLELFKTSEYQDTSLSNWLSLMPPHVVQNHLGFSDATMKKLEKFRSHTNQVVQGDNDGSGRKLKRDLVAPYGGRQMWA
ncbi:unnamed protein product [Parajaminaea phylloscopi]